MQLTYRFAVIPKQFSRGVIRQIRSDYQTEWIPTTGKTIS